MEELGSFKEFYDVVLKTTYPIEINGRTIEAGETIARFDKISIAGLKETTSRLSAHGGYNDADRVFWESTKSISLAFSQGVFSQTHLALMANSQLFQVANEVIAVNQYEKLESDEQGNITLSHYPCSLRPIFVYNQNTGDKIEFTSQGNVLHIDNTYLDVIVDYYYDYNEGASILIMGKRLFNSAITLEGKTKVKDDVTGIVTTGILRIPRLRLLSDLSIRLGTQASPQVASFSGEGLPVGEKNMEHVCEFFFLQSDIDSDM